MRLNIAVQMDPIERINIRGDSTFALLLEAQQRGHAISYYTPDRLGLTHRHGFATPHAPPGGAPGWGIPCRGASRAAPSSRRSTWCCYGRTRPSTSPM